MYQAVQIVAPAHSLSRGSTWSIAAIGASPILLALASWSPLRGDSIWEFMRFTGTPVFLVELFVILAAFRSGRSPTDMLRGMPGWRQAAFAGLAAIAVGTAIWVAPDPALAWFRNIGTALHLLFGISLYALLRASGPMLHQWLWPAVTAGMLGYFALVILFVGAHQGSAAFDWVTFGLGVINIRQTGLYASIGVGAALGLALAARHTAATIGWSGAATLLFALACWTGTRGSLLALGISLLTAFWVVPALGTRRILAIALPVVAGGMLLSLVHQPPHETYGLARMLSSVETDDIGGLTSGRTEIWLGTLDAIASRPLFGHGDGQFRLTVTESLGLYNHPHNVVLQILLHWGAVGSACLLALLLPLAPQWLQRARTNRQHLPAFLVAASILAFSTIEGALYFPYSTMMAVLSLASVLAIDTRGISAMSSQRECRDTFLPAPMVRNL